MKIQDDYKLCERLHKFVGKNRSHHVKSSFIYGITRRLYWKRNTNFIPAAHVTCV
jgi:hypothetical protein